MRTSFSRLVVIGLLALASCSGGDATPGPGGGGNGGNGSKGGSGPGQGGDGNPGGNGPGDGGDSGSGGMDDPNRPAIASFTATPAMLPAAGGKVTLAWSVTNADSLSIDNGVGAVTGASVEVTVTTTTTFTLTATNKAGSNARSAMVAVAAAPAGPVIVSFTAMPGVLPMAGGQTTLAWKVLNATSLSIDNGVGAVTGDSKTVNVTATTIYTLTASNNDGSTKAVAAVVIGQNPAEDGTRFAAMVSPTNGETFLAPATLHFVGIGRDPNVDTNKPAPGLGGNASQVQFFVDDQMALVVTGDHAEYYVFKGFVSGVKAGTHRVWARAIYVSPPKVLDSEPFVITVVDPPVYARTVTLDADLVVPAGQPYELAGTPGQRIRLNGNGHKISGGGSGAFTLKYVDAFDLGDRVDTTKKAIDVTTSGIITIEDSAFDSSNTIGLTSMGTATASIQRNVFHSNMRMPIGQNPGAPSSFPSLLIGGTSTGAKVFAANNVGAGWVYLN
jgi:hypothetical protein